MVKPPLSPSPLQPNDLGVHPVEAMQAATKLPLLRLGALVSASQGDGSGHGRDEDELPPLTSRTSPSRAAQLLVNSAPCASTASLGSTKRQHAPSSRKPGAQPEDYAKSPLELATEQLRVSRERLSERMARLAATQTQFSLEETPLAFVTQQLHALQQALAAKFARFFDLQARQIQRAFRGHRGRRVFRQLVAVRAVLRIQKAFRASRQRRAQRRKRLRQLCRRVLRGLRSVRERHELAHHELLSRVNHNLLIETQWRRAMGIDDAESDLMAALYRKRYVRRRLGELLRRANALRSIVAYWRGLVPTSTDLQVEAETSENQGELDPIELQDEASSDLDEDDSGGGEESSVIVIRKAPGPARGSSGHRDEVPSRPELLRRQRDYTRRVQGQNQRREAAHARTLDKQRELEQFAESEKRQAEEQRRRERAKTMQQELERRGLHAIRTQQAEKERGQRQQLEAEQRAAQAKREIAAQVLSPETQQRMLRLARRQAQRQRE